MKWLSDPCSTTDHTYVWACSLTIIEVRSCDAGRRRTELRDEFLVRMLELLRHGHKD